MYPHVQLINVQCIMQISSAVKKHAYESDIVRALQAVQSCFKLYLFIMKNKGDRRVYPNKEERANGTLSYGLYLDTTASMVSPEGESKTVLKLLAGKCDGFFVECGAYDGESYSNTLPLEKYYNWTGLLIEADYATFQQLISKRRKAWAINACIHKGRKPEKKEFIASLWTGSLAEHTTLIKHILVRLWRPVRTIRVWCFPLYTLLLAVNRTHVDYFSLDIEGGELDIIRSTPFGSKLNLKMLEVEYTIFQGMYFDKDLSKRRLEAYREHFRQLKGFKEAKKLTWDVIFVNTTTEES